MKLDTYIAFSGGVESRTMALMYGGFGKPIFADTGFEHQEMYDSIDNFERRMKEYHGDHFEIIRLQRDGTTLPEEIRERQFYPSFNARYCTRRYKIQPIDRFLRQQGRCELMVGLNVNEVDGRAGNHGLLANVQYVYPLADIGMNRQDCIDVLEEMDLMPELPSYMRRGGCVGCFYKSKEEYRAMAIQSPEEADRVADLEDYIQGDRDERYSIHPQIPNMREFVEKVRESGEDVEAEKVSMRDHINCGVFCHR